MNGVVFAAILAAGVGFGILLIGRGLRRRTPELYELVAPESSQRTNGLAGTNGSVSTGAGARPNLGRAPEAQASGLQRAIGQPGVRLLQGIGLADSGTLREQLDVLGISLERHAYEKLLAGLVGLVLPLILGMVAISQGIGPSPLLIVIAALVLGAFGFWYPDLPLADKVQARRQAFRHSLAGYLDLVTIIVAGGGGIESALIGAAEAGDGWVFAELRSALRRGELTGRPPWEMFEELGVFYGIDELQELAASMSLAGGHGARVQKSLVAKAESLRSAQAAEIETQAEASTEKMVVPVSLMVLGLMVFIGRGAMAAVMGS